MISVMSKQANVGSIGFRVKIPPNAAAGIVSSTNLSNLKIEQFTIQWVIKTQEAAAVGVVLFPKGEGLFEEESIASHGIMPCTLRHRKISAPVCSMLFNTSKFSFSGKKPQARGRAIECSD